MTVYFKNIKLFIIVSIILAFTLQVNASELTCGILKLQQNRSSGVNMSNNKCEKPPYISKGTVFNLSAKGRLWLKSNAGLSKLTHPDFQMICQNKTDTIFPLEFSDSFFPWLNLSQLNNCTGWVANRLSCDGQKGEKNALYCVLNFSKPIKKSRSGFSINQSKTSLTTFVKMRQLPVFINSEKNDFYFKNQLFKKLKTTLNLCKELNQVLHTVAIDWVIETTGQINNINIISEKHPITDRFSECLHAVIKTTLYPTFSKQVSFNHLF